MNVSYFSGPIPAHSEKLKPYFNNMAIACGPYEHGAFQRCVVPVESFDRLLPDERKFLHPVTDPFKFVKIGPVTITWRVK